VVQPSSTPAGPERTGSPRCRSARTVPAHRCPRPPGPGRAAVAQTCAFTGSDARTRTGVPARERRKIPMTAAAFGPVVGFRQWDMRGDDLLSTRIPTDGSDRYVWPSRVDLTAVCLTNPSHPAPVSGCECGIHAARAPSKLPPHLFLDRPEDRVEGIVTLWGAIEMHRRGDRAQHARLLALLQPRAGAQQDRMTPIARRYGVPVIAREGALAFAAEHGQSTSGDLTPGTEFASVRAEINAMARDRAGRDLTLTELGRVGIGALCAAEYRWNHSGDFATFLRDAVAREMDEALGAAGRHTA